MLITINFKQLSNMTFKNHISMVYWYFTTTIIINNNLLLLVFGYSVFKACYRLLGNFISLLIIAPEVSSEYLKNS